VQSTSSNAKFETFGHAFNGIQRQDETTFQPAESVSHLSEFGPAEHRLLIVVLAAPIGRVEVGTGRDGGDERAENLN
jgi:hypothetical protein